MRKPVVLTPHQVLFRQEQSSVSAALCDCRCLLLLHLLSNCCSSRRSRLFPECHVQSGMNFFPRHLFAISLLCLTAPLGLSLEEKKHDDNSWLLMCDMYHTQQQNDSDKFVINAIVSPPGCQLTCVVLESSSKEQKGFFDRTVTHLHNLNDGIYCKRDHVCKAGACTLELTDTNSISKDGEKREKMGIVVIDVLDAYVPQKDTITYSDAYVKIVVKSPQEGDVKIGKTKVVWDTDRPTFNTTVKIEKVSISSTIFFEIFDRDMMGPDDYIAAVYAALKTILKQERNHKEIKLFFLSKYYLRVKISWIAYE